MAEHHNVFISHRHEDDKLVSDLTDMLSAHGAKVRNSSITSDSPNDAHSEDYIKKLLRDKINWAGKIVVLITPDTKNHWWVDWEVEYADRLGDKKIIGVWAPGAEGTEAPEALTRLGDGIVPWDGDAIANALDSDDGPWQGPDGAQLDPLTIRRLAC